MDLASPGDARSNAKGTEAHSQSPASTFAATSKVSVVHGIPGQPVDVYVNGERTLENFQPGDVAGPLSLEEGSYDIALTKPGEAVGQAILTVNDAEVPGGANIRASRLPAPPLPAPPSRGQDTAG